MCSIPSRRGSATFQTWPALQHDNKMAKRILAVGFLLIILIMRLHAVKESVNLAESMQQQERRSAEFHHHNGNSNSSEPLLTTASKVLQMPLARSATVHTLATTPRSSSSSNLKSCANTIVTGYFPLHSKHSGDNYLKWMKNMLSIQDCMVVMTSPPMVETIQTLRAHAVNGTVIIAIELDDLPIAQLHHANDGDVDDDDMSFWTNQLEMDREKKLHKSYKVFWIWLSKTWFVLQAIEKDYFHSSFYMWQDIGAFRNHEVSPMLDGCVLRVIFIAAN
jgi:Bacterial protein of unknown function (HtrL_YibB)